MDIFLLFIIILILYNMKFYVKNFNTEYLDKNCTDSIKGIFVIFVFFRHFTSYVSDFGPLDMRMVSLNHYLDQLIVVMFLFYSGFGIAYAIKNKGDKYIRSMPKRRIFPVLIRFDIVVGCFWVLGVLMGRSFTFKKIILSLIGIEGLGNSHWYIFGIICLYAITYLSGRLTKHTNILLGINFIAIVSLIFILSQFKEEYWYNTLIAYFLGLCYAFYREAIEKFLFNNIRYLICLISFVCLYQYCRTHSSKIYFYGVMVILFAMIILLITMKLKVSNQYLLFLGRHLFSLYILQRIPMIYFKNRIVSSDRLAYFFLCIIITIAISVSFDYITNKLIYKICKV